MGALFFEDQRTELPVDATEELSFLVVGTIKLCACLGELIALGKCLRFDLSEPLLLIAEDLLGCVIVIECCLVS